MLVGYLPEEIKGSIIELRTYLSDSFGSNVRLDYGTGHELAFTFFLYSQIFSTQIQKRIL